MVQSKATTVDEYLNSLPADREGPIRIVHDEIIKNLPKGYEVAMNWGMITYQVPLSTEPDTYNGQPLLYAALASQKNHMAVYLGTVYGNPAAEERFREEYKATGKKMDMGKSCVRFKKLEDLPLELIGKTIASTPVEKTIELYRKSRKK